MAATNTPASAPLGSYAASVIYSRTLMARAMQRRTFRNKLSGPIPMDQWASSIGKKETSHSYPVVQVMDLAKMSGDRVTVDILDRVPGAPSAMGDKIAKNNGVPISHQRDEVRIDQARKVLDVGGRMSQQRTPHDLRANGQSLALDWLKDFQDNCLQIHMAGERGDATGIEWKVPLKTDPDFDEILVNPVTPPTRNRYLALDSATTQPSDIDTTDVLTLNSFDRFRTILDTDPVPLQGVRFDMGKNGIVEGEDSELLLCFVSAEQWNTILTQASGQNYRQFLADASTRLGHLNHPLFRNGQCGIWRDIVICQAPRPIQFSAGYGVNHYDTDGTTVIQSTAGVRLHRGVILGAQALACAYGNADRWTGADAGTRGSGRTDVVGLPYSWVEKLEDGDNQLQLFIGCMDGTKKLKYTFDGVPTDNGVAVFDSYQPSL